MIRVSRVTLPDGALLDVYRRREVYTDCYRSHLPAALTLAEFVTAFYTTWLFRLERVILARFAPLPSSDEAARRVAAGDVDAFAAWTVERRGADQLLLCDVAGNTRSWFMVAAHTHGSTPGTDVYFGSAVVPVPIDGSPRSPRARAFALALGLHRLYSRALLYLAVRRARRVVAHDRGAVR